MSKQDDIEAAFGPHIETWRKYLSERTGLTVKAPKAVRASGAPSVQWEFDLPASGKDEMAPAYFVRITFDPDTNYYGLYGGFRTGKGKVERETGMDDVFLDMLGDPALLFSWVGKKTEEYVPGDVDVILDELEDVLGPRSGGAC